MQKWWPQWWLWRCRWHKTLKRSLQSLTTPRHQHLAMNSAQRGITWILFNKHIFLEHQVCSRIIKSQSRWYPNRGISSHLRIKVGHFDLWNVLKKVWLDCAVRTSQVPQLPWMSKSKWVGEPDTTFCISLVRFPWPSRWIRPSSSLKSSHLSKAWKRSSSLLLWWNFNFLSTHFSSGIFLKPVRRRKSFWKSIGPNLSRSEKRNKTRPNWARKVLKLTMGDMFNCSCPPCPCPRLWVGEVAWLRGEDRDGTEEEGIFVADDK